MEEAGNRMSQTRPSMAVGSEAWLNRITTNKANMDSINMLPVAGQGQFDPEVMKRDVGSLYKRLKRMDRWLINPSSAAMQYWDFVVLFAMAFTCTITPYEVCMLWQDQGFDTLFYINIVINLIFVVDTTFQFFLPYKLPLKVGGGLIKNHKKIALHYLESWFIIDFISIFPIDYILAGVTVDASNLGLLSATRMLRLLRLVKLVRILRASRIFSRWENSISMKFAYRDLLSFTGFVILTLHWLSCALGMAAQIMQYNRSPQLLSAVAFAIQGDSTCYGCIRDDPTYGKYCVEGCLTPCELALQARIELPSAHQEELEQHVNFLKSQQSWVCRETTLGTIRPMPEAHAEVWVAGLYAAMMMMGGGVGSIYPTNIIEYVLFLVGIAMGSVLWANVVGTICGISATGNPFNMAYKHNMDQLNYFLEDMSMPKALRHRAREYLRNARELGKKVSYNELVDRLSPEVRKDLVLKMSKTTLQCVWYLNALGDTALVELAMRLVREGYAPRERLSPDKLTILMRGVAAKAGIILTFQGGQSGKHPFWGEDIILSSTALRDRKPAAALTYVEVATLTKADVDFVCAKYTDAKEVIHNAAVQIGMRRAMVVVADYIKTQQTKEMAFGGQKVPAKLRKKGMGKKGATAQPTEGPTEDKAAVEVISKIRGAAEEYGEARKSRASSHDFSEGSGEGSFGASGDATQMLLAQAQAVQSASNVDKLGSVQQQQQKKSLFSFGASSTRSAGDAGAGVSEEKLMQLVGMVEQQGNALQGLTQMMAKLSASIERLDKMSA